MFSPALRASEADNSLAYSKAYDFFIDIEKKGLNFEHLSRRDIEEYQQMMVDSVCQHAADNNIFYRETLKLSNTGEHISLAAQPSLLKETIRGDTSLIKCCDDSRIGQIHLTSGTTGVPTYLAYTLADQYIYDLMPQYPSLFPYNSNDTIGIALPYEFALPALGFQRLFQFVFGATCLSLGKGGYMAPVDKVLDLMKVYRPTVIATTPSYAALLYDEAQKRGYDTADFGVQSIILTGEGCSYTYRNRLEEIWKAKMFFFYGSTEIGLIGAECKQQQGYHIGEGHVVVEVVDEDGQLLDDGEVGELVVTTLLREGMPMIRYRTEDKGYVLSTPCDCGCNMKKLFLLGRDKDQLSIGDERISPFILENIILKCGKINLWYQFHLSNSGNLKIRCEKISPMIVDQDVISEIRELVKEYLKIDCDVEICSDIPRNIGKNQRVFITG